MALKVIFVALHVIIVSFTILILFLLYSPSAAQRSRAPKIRQRHSPTHLLVVLGSGGHTAEMLSMLRRLPLDPTLYTYRTYVVSSGDGFSAAKAVEFEETFLRSPGVHCSKVADSHQSKVEYHTNDYATDISKSLSYTIVTVPRARYVHQSFVTSPYTTLKCFWACLKVLQGMYPEQQVHLKTTELPYPDLILTNGPAIAVCIVLAAKLLRLIDFILMSIAGFSCGSHHQVALTSYDAPKYHTLLLRTIFIESWARVTSFSLSGKILLPFVDRFLVQWPTLAGRKAWRGGKETEFVGALVE